MRVVLVALPNIILEDPRIGPPLGLLYLVSWARAAGWNTDPWEVIDLNVKCYDPTHACNHWSHDFSIERCLREIPQGADVYGFSVMSAQMSFMVPLISALREREPHACFVCGGAHPSAMPNECTAWFDSVVVGEGEDGFLSVLASVMGHDAVRVQQKPIENLDVIPYPARYKLDFGQYTRRIAGEPATNIITSRGCPNRCVYCQQDSLWGEGVRMRSVQNVLGEIDEIKHTIGIHNFLFLDDSFTARSRSDMLALAHGLGERGAKWRGWTRADLLCRDGWGDVLKEMHACGCQSLCIGVEAGTDRVLHCIRKHTTVDQNSKALERVAASGMQARCSFMVGCPGERWVDIEALITFIETHRSVINDWILSVFVPLPGTPVWENPSEFGIVVDKATARGNLYRDFFVVGGNEQSGRVHRYAKDGTDSDAIQDEIGLRHRYVQETLLRLAPRNRMQMVN